MPVPVTRINSESATQPDPTTGKPTQYQIETWSNGEVVTSRWDPEKQDWVQVGAPKINDGVKKLYDAAVKADADAAKAAKPDESPKTITKADGSIWQYDPTNTDPDISKRWVMVAPPKGGGPGEPPTLHTFPDGSQGHWDPAAKNGQGDWVIDFTKPQGPQQSEVKPGTTPALNLPAGEGGRLALVEAQYKQYSAGLNANTKLLPEQRTAMLQAYIDTHVTPAVEEEVRLAKEKSDRVDQRQREMDQRAKEAADRAARTEERQQTAADRQAQTAEATQRLAEQKFSYQKGQDAVASALALMPYSADPGFSPALAGIYNRILPGSVPPGAFSFNLPNPDAIAAAHVDPLLATFNTPVAPRQAAASVGAPGGPAPIAGAAPPAPAAVPAVTPGAAPAAGTPIDPNRDRWYTGNDPLAGLPYVPQPRPSMPGAATAIGAGGIGGNPTQEEIARRLLAGYGP